MRIGRQRCGRAGRWVGGLAFGVAATASLAVAQTAFESVNPLIGTANEGNTFPGASAPFGMVQWSPDTTNGWYYYNGSSIRGFSLTHLSGVGCPIQGDMPMLPWSVEPAADRAGQATEAIGFRHADEVAQPGFYSVTLADGTSVELVVTERAGMARLRFAPGKHAGVLLNGPGSASADVHMDKLPPVGREHDGESLTVGADGSVAGTVTAGGFCGSKTRYTLHVVFETKTPAKRAVLWQDGHAITGKRADGKQAAAWLDLGEGAEQLLKVGLSYVSEEKARANLRAEMPGWDFDASRAEAKTRWTKALAAVAIEGGRAKDRTIFYTGLYHNLLVPNLFSDVDGEYMGFDETPHHVRKGQTAQYANFSDWDIYRDTTPLQAWLEPKRAGDMAQSLVNDAEQMGSFPRWALANDSTYIMGGDSPPILLAETNAFGARNFDRAAALRMMLKTGTTPGLGAHGSDERVHLAAYQKLGYLPISTTEAVPWDISASETLEFVNADFATAEFARAMGDAGATTAMLKRAESWRNLMDPETKWIRPRNADGTWVAGFDAEKGLPHNGDTPVGTDQKGFQEGNTYQYSFMVPFDYAGLFQAMGGEAVAETRLDRFFTKLVCWGEPCFNMANEPDFVTPYAYTFMGKPGKTAAVIERIEDETFNTGPSGLAGNDDLGATSAVYVWNALGMYPAIPGLGGVVLGTPRFDRARVQLGEGQSLDVERTGKGIYVQGVTLNGVAHPSSWLRLDELRAGRNTIRFAMGPAASATWGVAMKDRPPSVTKP